MVITQETRRPLGHTSYIMDCGEQEVEHEERNKNKELSGRQTVVETRLFFVLGQGRPVEEAWRPVREDPSCMQRPW